MNSIFHIFLIYILCSVSLQLLPSRGVMYILSPWIWTCHMTCFVNGIRADLLQAETSKYVFLHHCLWMLPGQPAGQWKMHESEFSTPAQSVTGQPTETVIRYTGMFSHNQQDHTAQDLYLWKYCQSGLKGSMMFKMSKTLGPRRDW